MLSKKCGKKINGYVPDYVVFDLETTGISCKYDEVVEIAALKVSGGEVTDEFATLVNPGRPIPFAASEVNGITDDMVKDSPAFADALDSFIGFAGDSVLVGHNIARFDLQFLCRDAEKFWGQTLGNDYIDTLDISRVYLPRLSHHTLSDVAKHYGISADGAHRALADCRMNQKVFECLKNEMENPSEDAKNTNVCPRCGSILRKRSGKYGEFLGCTGYPLCRYTRNL